MLLMNVTLALLSFTVLPIMFLIAAFWQRPFSVPSGEHAPLSGGQCNTAREHFRHARDPKPCARRAQPHRV